MKYIKIFSMIALYAIMLLACNNSKKQELKQPQAGTFHYKINMDITNVRGPVVLIDRSSFEPVKTIYPNKSKCTIEGELPMNKLHSYFVLHFPSKYPDPYMYPLSEACSINFDMDKENSIKAHYDSLLFAKVDNKFMNDVKSFIETNFSCIKEFDTFNNQSLIENNENRSEKEQIEFAEKGNDLVDKISSELLIKTGKFIDKEEMANILGYWGGQLGVEKLDSLSKLFTPEVKNTASYDRVIAIIDYLKRQKVPKSLKVGDKAPNFSLKNAKGKMYKLSDYKGKYVVLDFWASWCGPCKREMPFMKKLYKKYHTKGLEILAISTDQDREAWIKAKNELDMPYPQLHDKNGEVAAAYYVGSIPYVLLVDKEGIISGVERGEALGNLIEKKLK